MAELTEIRDTIPKIDEMANAEKSIDDTKLLSILARNRDKSGDWKNDTDLAWYMTTRNTDEKMENFEPDNVTEWKYRNLYSMSTRNGRPPASWSLCREAALPTAMLRNTSDESANDGRNFIITIREYLANYQESWGIPRTEYSFASLITVMGQATGRSLLALLYIVVNITPMAQILLHILRFVLDKTISIQKTNDLRQMIVKYAILGLQLLCVYVCLVFIFGFIVMPILSMAVGIFVKIMLYD